MPTFKDLERIVGRTVNERQPMRGKFRALIGHPDGETIDVDENPGYVFVRINGRADAVRQALCRAVLPRYNQPVIVAYNDELPNTLEVVGLDTNGFPPGYGGGSSYDGSAQLGVHANQHMLTGGDTVYVQTKQIMPMRARAIDPPTMEVYVEAGAYQYQAGFNYWGGGRSADFTAQIPSTVGTALYRLVYVDAATNALAYANTAEIQDDAFSADIDAILALIPIASVPIAAVRLYYGQTEIVETDISDLRSFVSSSPGSVTSRGAIVIWQHVYIVAKGGGDYTLIQSAINAASSGDAVLVMPGTYVENITMKDGVVVIGIGSTPLVIIAPAAGVPVTVPAGSSRLYYCQMNPPAGQVGIAFTGATGDSTIAFSYVASNGTYALDMNTGAATLRFILSKIAGDIRQHGTLYLGGCEAETITQVAGSGNLYLNDTQVNGNITIVAAATLTTRASAIIAGTITNSGTIVGSYQDGSGNLISQNKIRAKPAATAGIELDPNAATGNFILSLSPANLTADRRVTWVNAGGTAMIHDGTLAVLEIPKLSIGTGITFTSSGLKTDIITTSGKITINAAPSAETNLTIPDVVTGTFAFTDASASAGNVAIWSSAYMLTADAGLRYNTATDVLTVFGKVLNKNTGVAGIQLDRNAATGDFTLSLSPANLLANRRVTFGDLDGTNALGAGTITDATANDVSVANHTHALSVTFAAHNLLSATHGDTTAASATRGDIVTAQGASPTWSRLAKGSAGAVLTMDANEPLWTTWFLAGTATKTYTFPAETGTVLLGSSASATYIPVFSTQNAVAGDSGLTFASATLTIATTLKITGTSNQIVLQSAGVTGTLTWTPATSNKVVTLPNLTGTMTLGAGTLTVATANSVTVADHTHAITSSSNPGAAAAILATDASGILTTQVLKAADTTDSTSTTTGALQSAGGIAAAKAGVIGTTLGVGGVQESGYHFQVIASASAAGAFSSVRNSAAANTGNLAVYDMRLETTVQTRTVFVISGAFSTTTDASRTSDVLLRTAQSGTFGTTLELAGRNVVVGNAALATNATDGFLYIPTCAGTPTGTPTTFTGRVAMIYDTTNDKLYIFNATWKQPKVSGTAAIWA